MNRKHSVILHCIKTHASPKVELNSDRPEFWRKPELAERPGKGLGPGWDIT
jgi:hypothetical protein